MAASVIWPQLKSSQKKKKLTPRRGHAGLDDVAGGLGRSSSNFRQPSVTPVDDD